MEVENNSVILSMQEDIQSLKSDIKEIHDALIGDSFNPGFKQRIEKVELDTDKNTQRLNKMYSYGAAIISILGFAGIILGVLYKTGIL